MLEYCRIRTYAGVAGAMVTLALCLPSTAVYGDLRLASIFQDRMVLQRGQPIPVWGWDTPGKTVTVRCGAGQAATVADERGRWRVTLPALPASSEPLRLEVAGSSTVTCHQVLAGEVWLAAGQSNMDMALFWTVRGRALAATANRPDIRYFKVRTTAREELQESMPGSWSLCVSNSALNMSELAFHYAVELQDRLGVPVGIINSSWGGTSIEAWMSSQTLDDDPVGESVRDRWRQLQASYPVRRESYDRAMVEWEAGKESARRIGIPFTKPKPVLPKGGECSEAMPSAVYNAMIHPLLPAALRGVIWYQGENNTRWPQEYRTLFPSLIKSWRRAFEQAGLPFYWVQLPGYRAGETADWPGLRAAQQAALALPFTGQAVTIDIGEPGNIHPDNKGESARRLSLLALRRVYGLPSIVDSGPVFRTATLLEGGRVKLAFDPMAARLGVVEGGDPAALPGFEVAGGDGKFQKAQAMLAGEDAVVVTAPAGVQPAGVRYAWRNDPGRLALVNDAGLPAAPFEWSVP